MGGAMGGLGGLGGLFGGAGGAGGLAAAMMNPDGPGNESHMTFFMWHFLEKQGKTEAYTSYTRTL